LRSYCKNVFLAFFFFLGWALVVAHRIDWYGKEATQGISDLDAASEAVVNRLKGAISDRGWAMVCLWGREVVALISKVHRSFGGAASRIWLGILVLLRDIWLTHCNSYNIILYKNDYSRRWDRKEADSEVL
jgi:hypothetical protein